MEIIYASMDRKPQPKKKLASDLRKASMTTYNESYIRMLFSGAKRIKRKDRKAYYEQIPETERKRFLDTYSTWEKDIFADDRKERLAAYAKIFIENVPKEERARFHKNLDEDMKEDFLKDYPSWKNDI